MLHPDAPEEVRDDANTYAEWRQLYRHFSEHWAAVARAPG